MRISILSVINRALVCAASAATIVGQNVGADGKHVAALQSTSGVVSSGDKGAAEVIARIDVGNIAAYTDNEGRVWSPDTEFFSPERAFAESRGQPEISGAKDPTIYRTYRGNVGGSTPQAERHLTFRIPVRRHEAVDLRLHFAELYWGAPGGGPAGPGKRIFDVEAGGRIVLSDFDITRAAGQALTSVVVPISNVKIENNVLTLTLKAKTDFAAISAIEVFSHR